MTNAYIIDRYTNCEVEIFYLTESATFRDKGTISECDGTWVILRKPGNEVFLVPISAVRIIKVLNPPKEAESLLLRPAEPEPEQSNRRLSSKS